MRESPAVRLIGLLERAGAKCRYHDPTSRSFAEHGLEMSSVPLDPARYDVVVIATAHYERSTTPRSSTTRTLVVDLRNATGRAGITSEKIWKL